jgi:predicted aspartyl protease
MKHGFDALRGLVIIPVHVTGPLGRLTMNFALDTGATTTLIRPAPLQLLGYNLESRVSHVKMTTGSTVESVIQLSVQQITALDRSQAQFPVVVHSLPATAPIDGLLGLDFLRETRLEIDFRKGVVALEV